MRGRSLSLYDRNRMQTVEHETDDFLNTNRPVLQYYQVVVQPAVIFLILAASMYREQPEAATAISTEISLFVV